MFIVVIMVDVGVDAIAARGRKLDLIAIIKILVDMIYASHMYDRDPLNVSIVHREQLIDPITVDR